MPNVVFSYDGFPCQIFVANAGIEFTLAGANYDEQYQAMRALAVAMQAGPGELAGNILQFLQNPDNLQGGQILQQLFGEAQVAETTDGVILAISDMGSLLVDEDNFIDCGLRLAALL